MPGIKDLITEHGIKIERPKGAGAPIKAPPRPKDILGKREVGPQRRKKRKKKRKKAPEQVIDEGVNSLDAAKVFQAGAREELAKIVAHFGHR